MVVSLYNPYSQVDGISFAEARAGAQLADVGFVLNVLSQAQVGKLTEQLGLLPNPGLLIYARPSTLAARISGFADKETVAQAALTPPPSRRERPQRLHPAPELFVRHARRDGARSPSCEPSTTATPASSRLRFTQSEAGVPSLRPGPYTFADAHQATAFMTEAVEALMVLGCDVHAQ